MSVLWHRVIQVLLLPQLTAFPTRSPRATTGSGAAPRFIWDISLDDARVHVISESLVDARCVLVHRLVERVRGILVPLGKGDERQVIDKSHTHKSPHLGAHAELRVVHVEPERVEQVPRHECVVEGVQDGADETSPLRPLPGIRPCSRCKD